MMWDKLKELERRVHRGFFSPTFQLICLLALGAVLSGIVAVLTEALWPLVTAVVVLGVVVVIQRRGLPRGKDGGVASEPRPPVEAAAVARRPTSSSRKLDKETGAATLEERISFGELVEEIKWERNNMGPLGLISIMLIPVIERSEVRLRSARLHKRLHELGVACPDLVTTLWGDFFLGLYHLAKDRNLDDARKLLPYLKERAAQEKARQEERQRSEDDTRE